MTNPTTATIGAEGKKQTTAVVVATRLGGFSLVTFTPGPQLSYRKALAAQAGAPVDKVILTNIRAAARRHLGGEQRDRRLSRAFVDFDASIAAADAAAAAATERAVAAIAPAALVAAFVAELEAAKASGAFPAMAAVDVRALAGAITVDAKAPTTVGGAPSQEPATLAGACGLRAFLREWPAGAQGGASGLAASPSLRLVCRSVPALEAAVALTSFLGLLLLLLLALLLSRSRGVAVAEPQGAAAPGTENPLVQAPLVDAEAARGGGAGGAAAADAMAAVEAQQVEEAIQRSMLEHAAAAPSQPPPAPEARPASFRTPPRPRLEIEEPLSDDGDDDDDGSQSSGLAWSPGAFSFALEGLASAEQTDSAEADDGEAGSEGAGGAAAAAASVARVLRDRVASPSEPPAASESALTTLSLSPKAHVV